MTDKWDSKEKELEISLAKIHMLRKKAVKLAIDLVEKENMLISNDNSSLPFMLDISIGENNDTRLSLRRTIGELLRAETSMCRKFN